MFNSNFPESTCTKTVCVNIYCLECKKKTSLVKKKTETISNAY